MPFTFARQHPLLDARATRRGGIVCPVCSEPLAAPATVSEPAGDDWHYRAGVIFPAYIVEQAPGHYAFSRRAKRALDRHHPERVVRQKLPRAIDERSDRDEIIGYILAHLLVWSKGSFGTRLGLGSVTIGPPFPLTMPQIEARGEEVVPRVTPVPVTVVCRCGRSVHITRDTILAALRNIAQRRAPDDRSLYEEIIASLTGDSNA